MRVRDFRRFMIRNPAMPGSRPLRYGVVKSHHPGSRRFLRQSRMKSLDKSFCRTERRPGTYRERIAGSRMDEKDKEKDKEQELAKQLSTYADSFTAFSFVQGATFCFLLAQNVTVACAVRSRWGVSETCLLIAGAGYSTLLYLCHRGENKLIGVPGARSENINEIVRMVWKIRYGVVAVATLGEVLIVLGVRFANPVFDCSKYCL